ncbi:MAG: hypothetical protein IJ645_08650 [Ruminococcus sp.]|nr:hypothetical protein [Ruminococcus sp.]
MDLILRGLQLYTPNSTMYNLFSVMKMDKEFFDAEKLCSTNGRVHPMRAFRIMCRLSEGRYLQVRQRLLWAADWYIGH